MIPLERGLLGPLGSPGLWQTSISQAKMLTCGVTRGLSFGFSVCKMKSPSLLRLFCGVTDVRVKGWVGVGGYVGRHCPLVAVARVAMHWCWELEGASQLGACGVPFISVSFFFTPNFPGASGLLSHGWGQSSSANIHSAGMEWAPILCPLPRLELQRCLGHSETVQEAVQGTSEGAAWLS